MAATFQRHPRQIDDSRACRLVVEHPNTRVSVALLFEVEAQRASQFGDRDAEHPTTGKAHPHTGRIVVVDQVIGPDDIGDTVVVDAQQHDRHVGQIGARRQGEILEHLRMPGLHRWKQPTSCEDRTAATHSPGVGNYVSGHLRNYMSGSRLTGGIP
ncbi:hypothetical protein [Nocardia abscessus]|uniref:hypothetical protein n=1 Tax=Nocardia abscessus TaxID=120957 RepID=UPI0024544D74|nr:hypothetical protein [Nocardia abscessus]